MTPHELRQGMHGIIGRSVPMETTVVSFGFKYGPPKDADLLIDVRFLPNPQFVPELREFTGLEPAVSRYVLGNEDTGRLLDHYVPLLQFLLPRYAREGKRYLTVGVGCTGGKHRSVAITEEIVRLLGASGESVVARHRDAKRGI